MSDPHHALGRALTERGGASVAILHSSVADWASMTFEGHRHCFVLRGAGPGFVDGIEEAAFRLAGHIVADIAIVAGARAGETRVEALTLLDR